jgi:hypothetical protein
VSIHRRLRGAQVLADGMIVLRVGVAVHLQARPVEANIAGGGWRCINHNLGHNTPGCNTYDNLHGCIDCWCVVCCCSSAGCLLQGWMSAALSASTALLHHQHTNSSSNNSGRSSSRDGHSSSSNGSVLPMRPCLRLPVQQAAQTAAAQLPTAVQELPPHQPPMPHHRAALQGETATV